MIQNNDGYEVPDVTPFESMEAYKKSAKIPVTNTLSKDEFEERVRPVFDEMGRILSKSFGPYGSNTIIAEYPYTSTTKDGWTISKNILFADAIDRCIANMIKDVCGRLNNTVGDGTTSAIIATNALYKAYQENSSAFKDIPPRNIIWRFKLCADNIIKTLQKKYVTPLDPGIAGFSSRIRNVVDVASNGDEKLVKIIGDLYDELRYPAINVTLSPDGETKSEVVNGYSIGASLMDALYINNDNQTAEYSKVDAIILDHRVTASTFTDLIIPIGESCRIRGRHLLVMAPFYDERALDGVIKQVLNDEYRRTKDVNIVLMVYPARNANDKKRLGDLAMLMNTDILTKGLTEEIIDKLKSGTTDLESVINIDDRNIPGISVAALTPDGRSRTLVIEGENFGEHALAREYHDSTMMRLGFCDKAEVGLKRSIFNGFYYDEDIYNAHVKEAAAELHDAIEKYRNMATFNLETSWARERVASLKMKMGTISVGGDSSFSQGMLRDSADDAVKAAASAFNNGTVLGCHIHLKASIKDILNEMKDKQSTPYPGRTIDTAIYNILLEAFDNVQRTLFSNTAYTPEKIDEIISECSPKKGVYDISTGEYTFNIITSAETDVQILRAVVDLISLIISGNQMVYRQMQGTGF